MVELDYSTTTTTTPSTSYLALVVAGVGWH